MTDVTEERLREVLHYSFQTGVFTWRSKRGRKAPGQVAGTTRPDGYITIRIDGKRYLAHRLAWLYAKGAFPEQPIDHIDRKPSNNAFLNLRLVTHQENMHNQTTDAQPHNKRSGLRGVRYHQRCTLKPWQAAIKVGGTVKSLGYFPTPEEAHAAYLAARAKLHKGV